MNPGIFYLYEYNNAQKIRTVGFLKLTRYYHSCTLQLNARGIPVTRADTLKLCAFYLENNTVGSTVLADLPCTNHMLSVRLNFAECQFPDGHTLNTMDGFFLPLSGGRILAATVPGILVDTEKLMSAFTGPPAHNDKSDIQDVNAPVAENISSDSESTAADTIPDSENPAAADTISDSENPAAADTISDSESTAADIISDSENTAAADTISDSENPALQMQDTYFETDPAPVLKMQDIRSDMGRPAHEEARAAGTEEAAGADGKTAPGTDLAAHLYEAPLPSMADESPKPKDITPGTGGTAANGDAAPADTMGTDTHIRPEPVQFDTDSTEALTKNNRREETLPQKDGGNSCAGNSSPETPQKNIRKIQRSDMARLPRHYWHLANNSFLLHGYHNYSHLLLVEEGGRHWLGVPGVYDSREARAARLFGFPQFTDSYNEQLQLSADEKNTQGSFGYWCCYLK